MRGASAGRFFLNAGATGLFCFRRSRVYVASASLSGELGFLRVLVYGACDVHVYSRALVYAALV